MAENRSRSDILNCDCFRDALRIIIAAARIISAALPNAQASTEHIVLRPVFGTDRGTINRGAGFGIQCDASSLCLPTNSS